MSCTNNSPNINQTFIIESVESAPSISGCTGFFTNYITECTGDTVIMDTNVEVVGNITPENDSTSDIGTSNKRFREINTYRGNSTIWESSQEIITPNLNLGVDSENNNRIINADNSILRNDILLGGSY